MTYPKSHKRETGITALLIGAGAFGKHYVRILSRLNAKKIPNIPVIKTLVLTRTDLNRARESAEGVMADPRNAADEIVGVKAADIDDVKILLEQHRPQFIAVAARDPVLGDSIHVRYVKAAAPYGNVLCEKPFANATGDGSSLAVLKDLIDQGPMENAAALELPYAAVRRRMTEIPFFRNLFDSPKHIVFRWEAGRKIKKGLIDDLILHPWSLLPEGRIAHRMEVEDSGSRARIRMRVGSPGLQTGFSCEIRLASGRGFRGMTIDGAHIGFLSLGTGVEAVLLDEPFPETQPYPERPSGKTILRVENPLEQNIIAVLQNQPLTGLKEVYESQLFLETAHGYAPEPGTPLKPD